MFKTLSGFQKFQKGSLLWLIFFEPKRRLFRYINWRTGFLLHNLKNPPSVGQPVLIDTKNVFPNQSLLCLPLKSDSWFTEAHRHWKQMDKPSFRVFIPLDCDEEALSRRWPQSDSHYNLSYYKGVES